MNEQGKIEPQEISIRHEFIDGDALVDACIAGCGVAQLPTWLAGEAIKAGSLVQVLEGMSGGTMPIHVVWQKTWHSQPKVRVAIDELVQLSLTKPEIFSI
jgi:DNA-binding transcriptional LysR family regulator